MTEYHCSCHSYSDGNWTVTGIKVEKIRNCLWREDSQPVSNWLISHSGPGETKGPEDLAPDHAITEAPWSNGAGARAGAIAGAGACISTGRSSPWQADTQQSSQCKYLLCFIWCPVIYSSQETRRILKPNKSNAKLRLWPVCQLTEPSSPVQFSPIPRNFAEKLENFQCAEFSQFLSEEKLLTVYRSSSLTFVHQ